MIRGVATALAVTVVTAGAWLGSTSTAHAASLSFVPCHGTGRRPLPERERAARLERRGVRARSSSPSRSCRRKGTPRGVMMLVAGGPGQASALAFDLADLGSVWQSIFPGYTLVAFDPRGTGASGFLTARSTNPSLGRSR